MNTYIEKYNKMSIQAKAGVWFAICGILQKGIQFITTPIFSRLLTKAQFGEVSTYLSWYNIVTIFITLNLFLGGFNNGMIQNEDRRDEYLSSMQGLVTVLCGVGYLIYLATHGFWNALFEMDTLLVTVMFAEILFHSAISFWSARERFEYKYRALVPYTLIAIAIPQFAAVLAIWLAPNQYRTDARIITNGIFVVLICAPLYVRNIIKGKSFFNKEFWLFGLKFNLPLVPHYLSGIVLNQADRIMIEKMVGKAEAGIYSLAYSASMVLNVVTTAINQSFAPWIYEKLRDEDYDDIPKRTVPLFAGAAIMILMLVIFAPECIIIFGGKKYAESIWIVPSVAASLYFSFTFQIFANVEFFYMRKKYITYASVIGAILNIVLNYFVIDKFGYIGAGYTTLFCYIVFAVSHTFFVKKIAKECINGRKLFNTKVVFGIGATLILVSQLMLLLYKHWIIRYVILLTMAVFIVIYRNKIIKFVKEMKK